mgnify:CR=1 FL=1
MGMAIGGVNPYVNTYNAIERSSYSAAQKITTGSNYPNVSQGASEYAIGARLASNIGATSQSVQNTQNLSSMLKTAESATGNTIKALSTLKEHLIGAANDTNGSLDRAALQKQINQIVAQIDSNARVQYNGKNLLDGSRNSLTLSGIDGLENFQVGDLRSQVLGLTDKDGNVTIDVSTIDAANASLKIVDSASTKAGEILDSLHFMQDYVIDGLSFGEAIDEATTQGAQLQRLEFQQANYVTMEENQLAAQSNSTDSDIAKQVANLKSSQTQEQLALFGMKMFNQNRANILGLLP